MERLKTFAKSQYVEKAELVFKLCYLCLAFISFNTFCGRQWYLTTISYGIVALGLVIAFFRVLHIKDYLNATVYILIAFVISYFLASMNTLKYGYFENAKAITWMCIQYFLIFSFDKTRSEKSIAFERDALLKFVIVYTFLAAVIAIVMMLSGYAYFKVVEGYNIYGGFYWHRLFGCYMDCNYGAVLSVISIVLSAYYYDKAKRPLRVLLITNIIFELLFICYSDSRTGLVSMVAATIIFIVTRYYKNSEIKFYKSKQFWKGLAISLLVSVLLVLFLHFLQMTTSKFFVELARTKVESIGGSIEEQQEAMNTVRLGRLPEEINNGDVSNERFAIWGSAISIFKAHPILGVSFRNIMKVAYYELYGIFITIRGYDSMHNFGFDILASQGLVGIILVLLLISVVLRYVFKTYNNYESYGVSLSVIAAIFASMLFYSETFYMNTPGAFIFWYILGYMVNFKVQRGIAING